MYRLRQSIVSLLVVVACLSVASVATAESTKLCEYSPLVVGEQSWFITTGTCRIENMVNDGILTTAFFPISYEGSDYDSNLRFQLRKNTTFLDCYSETKTIEDWGLSPDIQPFLITGFSGSQCAMTVNSLVGLDQYNLYRWSSTTPEADFKVAKDATGAIPYAYYGGDTLPTSLPSGYLLQPSTEITNTYGTRIIDLSITGLITNSGTLTEDQGTRVYERTLGGYFIPNNFQISVTFDNQSSIGATTDTFWCVEVFNDTLDQIQSGTGDIHNDPIPITQTENTFSFADLPLGVYTGVYYFTSATAECSNASANEVFEILEGNNIDIFEVIDQEIVLETDYFIELSEINTSVSEKNPTHISFGVAKRPSTTFSSQSEQIAQIQGNGTVQTSFDNLTDGIYDVVVKYSNFGCSVGQTACPFPLAYIYSSFTLEGGIVTATGTIEQYDNLTPPILDNEYQNCGITDIGGCIANSFRFLFIPSDEAIANLMDINDTLETKAPFSYALDMVTVLEELTQTADAQTLDMTLDLGFGEITMINESMIANAPYASTIRQLMVYLLWLALAFTMYRMALRIHNKETV